MSDCCKAKEPEKVLLRCTNESGDMTCPKCGKEGQKVENVTVKSLVKHAQSPQVGEQDYLLCTTPTCEIVYFNNDTGKLFPKKDITVRVWFKETEDPIPVCYCANVTEKQIREEIAVKKRAKDLNDIKQYTGAMTGGKCKYTNPTGKCCGAVVNAAIKKSLGELASKY